MSDFYNRGKSLIGIIIVLIIAGLISGGLYYYLQKQIPKITEKPFEEEVVKLEEKVTPSPEEKLTPPKEEKSVVQKCADRTLYGQCSINKPKYCENGNLVNKCFICGCPAGQQCETNGNCIAPVTIFNYYDVCWDYDCSSKYPPYPKLSTSQRPNAIRVQRNLKATGIVDIFVVFLYAHDPLPEKEINILKGPESDGNSLRYVA
jgi:hypothetical protein